jgi:hypothetical protein
MDSFLWPRQFDPEFTRREAEDAVTPHLFYPFNGDECNRLLTTTMAREMSARKGSL